MKIEAMTLVKKLVIDNGVPNELGIDRDLYSELLKELPAHLRFSRNDGTENLIFPLFSDCKCFPLD